MRFYPCLAISLVLSTPCLAMSFQEALLAIRNHDSVEILERQSLAIENRGQELSSWGDPTLRVAAKNYPKDSLDDELSPMSGIDVGISQNIPLGIKYTHRERQYNEMARSLSWLKQDRQEILAKELWTKAIAIRAKKDEMTILEENLTWLNNIIKVSQNLYSTGKISQGALLDLKLRKSELKGQLSALKFELNDLQHGLAYLLPSNRPSLELSTVPWQKLEKQGPLLDKKEKALMAKLKSSQHAVSANKWARLPDLNLSVTYTQRNEMDGLGDFVTVGAAFPIPVSSSRHAAVRRSLNEQGEATATLADYQKRKHSQLAQIKSQIESLNTQLEIIEKESIPFASNSRDITAKSYQLGQASYLELLQSELKLQNIKLTQVRLIKQQSISHLERKALLGDSLYD